MTLTETELRFAAYVGTQRRIRALLTGRQHRYGYDGANNWSVHIEAAAAELAVAQVANRYWVDTYDPDYDGDVGASLQVRHTERESGCLIVHRSDEDSHAFVLVTGRAPGLTVRGWIRAREAKQERHWRTDTGRPAFFVPAAELRQFPDRRHV